MFKKSFEKLLETYYSAQSAEYFFENLDSRFKIIDGERFNHPWLDNVIVLFSTQPFESGNINTYGMRIIDIYKRMENENLLVFLP